MSRAFRTLRASVVGALLPSVALAQGKHFPLDSSEGLRLHNVVAQPVTHQGKQGVRVVADSNALRRLPPSMGQADPDLLAWIEGSDFSSGVIEAEIAGVPAPGSDAGARGFVGIAFRLQRDEKTYDAFYLRPTNGRADDQERRNHATQYISHPDWPWFRLRRDAPSKYESYVDLVPDAWTKIRIEVHGAQARLYVHDQPQPVLVVNDVKTGATAKGSIALWIGPGTIGHFRNLTVTPAREPQ
jgi:hypothetical protein